MVTTGPAGQRKAILPQLDKLFDERVVLGTAMGSQETIRYALIPLAMLSLPLFKPLIQKVVGIWCRGRPNSSSPG